MSPPFLRTTIVFIRLSKKFVHSIAPALNVNSWEFCMLAYLHIKIQIWYGMVTWSDELWYSYYPFSIRIFHQTVSTHKSSNILNGNSKNLCIHMVINIYISLRQFDQTIFEGVIEFFHFEYIIKKFFVHTNPAF